ncbi:Exostosin-3, partial [Stegodyphus mimosarum]
MEDLESIKAVDLKGRIEEMIRIKISVSDELRDLESRRQRLQSDISILSQRMEDLKADYTHQQVELERLRVSVEQAQYAQKEVQEKNSPHISPPKRILPSLEDGIFLSPASMKGIQSCRTHLCFDFSRCSLTSGFPVYFYHPDDFGSWNPEDQLLKSAITEALNINIHITFDPTIACVYVVLVGEIHEKSDTASLENYLKSLTHWNGDGRNHILLNLALEANRTRLFAGVNTGRAIIVQPCFHTNEFRSGFDIMAPPLILKKDHISEIYLYSPARRKFLLSYQGEYRTFKSSSQNNSQKPSASSFPNSNYDSEDLVKISRIRKDSDDVEESIIDVLKKMQLSNFGDNFFFQFSCAGSTVPGLDSEWLLCGSYESRTSILKDSTFSLLISPANYNLISTPQIHIRIYEALKTGAIPVILGSHINLPFSEFLDWNRAAIILPKARVTELHYYLRTFTDNDIMAIRHQGRMLFDHYFANPRQVIATILAVIRNRIQIPAPAAREETSPSVFNGTFRPLRAEFAAVQDPDPEENLGPVESPFPSLSFQRNLTYTNAQRYFVWNDIADPFTLYPYTPFDPLLPSESKFVGSSFGFRPIGQGTG